MQRAHGRDDVTRTQCDVLPINEPAEGRRKSQIEEYLDYYGSPGVQHIALRTSDIVAPCGPCANAASGSSTCRATYYDEARDRMGAWRRVPWNGSPSWASSSTETHEGYLLQIFTECVTDRPTVFFEIIQREGRRASAKATSRRCSKPSRREQERRGNL